MIDPATGRRRRRARWSTGAARERIDPAASRWRICPGCSRRWSVGWIDGGRAREIMVGTCELAPETGCGWQGRWSTPMTHTCGQVRAWLARRIARLIREAAISTCARVKKRCVRLWADLDGWLRSARTCPRGGGPSNGKGVNAGRGRGDRRARWMLPTRMRSG